MVSRDLSTIFNQAFVRNKVDILIFSSQVFLNLGKKKGLEVSLMTGKRNNHCHWPTLLWTVSTQQTLGKNGIWRRDGVNAVHRTTIEAPAIDLDFV